MSIHACLKILRPQQWLKNLMIFFPPFLSGSMLDSQVSVNGMPAFIAFCLASSSGYILNDILDSEKDRLHPQKKNRPLPSGVLNPKAAATFAVLLLCVGVGLAAMVSPPRFMFYLVLYLLLTALYSLKIKDIPLLDVFFVATGFIVRLQAGGEAFAVSISDWLFLSVFLLALFLSIGKRLTEKRNLGGDANLHRKSLGGYPDGFLEGSMYLTGGAVLVTYSMYTLSRNYLFYTVPLCCFGLLRYIMRVKSGLSGDPTESLLKDVPLLLVGLVWVIIIGWRLYIL
ncbi:MAG: decaprenyl-phosphate phosphoribosyltransferase [Desulfuromonadales bacterium]|nr:MAG: decaprenyl-phosphate phosphoribosyltransferase [Desulfuromonadales bacterium]